MRTFVKYPSTVQAAADPVLFKVDGLRPEEWAPRLQIKARDIEARLLEGVSDAHDREILEYLIQNKVFPTALNSADLRNNPYYALEDKLIQLQAQDSNSRTYGLPYAGQNRFEYGRIYDVQLTIFDDDNVEFGNQKIRPVYSTSIATLKRDYYSAR